MARVAINTGSAANDGTGDTLRAAGGVINDNFLEVYTYLGAGSTTTLSAPVWSTTSVGINTLRNVGIGTTNPRFALEVGAVGASGTTLFVNGDARITGILTIGTSSITLNGSTNIINVGTGVTINGSTGIISATSIVVGGTTLTGAAVTRIEAGSGISVDQNTGQVTITATGGGGSSQFVTTAAGIHTLSNVGIGTTNPTSKLTVTGDGTFTGVVTASSFSGSASGLTGIPAGQLTGVLPALDGSALTGVVGSGSGIVVKDSGTTVGTAGTIDFGDNLTVSAIFAGIVTVTASSGSGSSQFVTTAAGIHTLSNVGIGTTNPTSALTVVGSGTSTSQLFVTGVSTFVGLITAGRITAGLTSSIIPFYYDTYASLPSYSTYHGAVAHAHDTGKLYYAHTRWVELVNTEADGTVGTGTEKYNIGITSVTTLNVSGISTFGGGTQIISSGEIKLENLSRIMFGYSGSTPNGLVIRNNQSSDVTEIVQVGGDDIQIQADSGRSVFIGNDNITNNLTVAGYGVTVTGPTLFAKQLNVSGVSTFQAFNSYVEIGNPSYYAGLRVFSSGTVASILQSGGGDLYLTSHANRNISLNTYAIFGDASSEGNVQLNNGQVGTTKVGSAITFTANTGNISATSASLSQLSVSGVSTVGVVTGATYYGDASYVVSGKWTVGNNGANDYTFTGIGFTETTNDPILYLARGGVYEFVITSGASHPFLIRVSNGGATYNNGITSNGATSGTIRFEVPFNAPNTLYYQCTNHSGMGNTISIYPNTI